MQTPDLVKIRYYYRIPMDASDRIRKVNEITVFSGYIIKNQLINPRFDVSTICRTVSTPANLYTDYDNKVSIEKGRIHFSTLQGRGTF